MRKLLCLFLSGCLLLCGLAWSAGGEETPAPAQEALSTPAPDEGPEETLVPLQTPGAAQETRIAPLDELPDYVEWLLEIARGELGYREERSGATKYGVWTGDPTAEWCAEFLCWCVDQVDRQHGTQLLNSIYPYYTGTNTGRDWFLKQGRYIARKGTVPGWGSQWNKITGEAIAKNSYIPQPGDWMFFSTSALGDTTHVAMVEYCAYDEQGGVRVHVIEGNNPDSVARNVYSIDHWAILGYGTVYDLADITLRFGSAGEKVMALQSELVEAGLLEGQYITGRYGALTEQAVKQLQRKAGLSESGVANRETRLALKDYIAQRYREHPELWVVEQDENP